MTTLNSNYSFLLKTFLISIILISSDIKSQSLQQTLTLELNNVRFIQALEEIEKRTDFSFLFIEEEFKDELPVSINVKEKSIEEVLEILTLSHNVSFKRIKNNIAVKRLKSRRLKHRFFEKKNSIKGCVRDLKTGKPIIDCNLIIEGTTIGASTNKEGFFEIKHLSNGSYILVAKHIGYGTQKVKIHLAASMIVKVDFELKEKELRLGNVVITTGTIIPTPIKKLPNTISVITARDIEKTNPADIGEVYRLNVPGSVYKTLSINTEGGKISVRGVGSFSTMKTFIDGVEMADPEKITFIEPSIIEKIEVLPGPQASTIYGSGALGGVTHIFTKKGFKGKTKLSGSAETIFVDNKYFKERSPVGHKVGLSARGGSETLDYNIGVNYKNAPTWLDLFKEDAFNIFGSAGFTSGDFSAYLTLNYSKYNNEGGIMAWEADLYKELNVTIPPLDDLTNNKMQIYGLNLIYNASKNWIHKITIGYNHHNRFFSMKHSETSELFRIRDYTRKRWTFSYNTSYNMSLSKLLGTSLILGADYSDFKQLDFDGLSEERFALPLDDKFISKGVNSGYFGQVNLSFNDFLFLTAGLRGDKMPEGTTDTFTWSPRLGLSVVREFDRWMLKGRISWGQAVLIPRKEATYVSETLAYIVLPNPNLKPEIQKGYEIGVDIYLSDLLSLGITYFNQNPKNLIDEVEISQENDGKRVFEWQNLSEIKNEGIELTAVVKPLSWCRLKFNYGKTKSTVTSLEENYTGKLKVGESPLGIPNYNIAALLELYPLKKTKILLEFIQIGELKNRDFQLYWKHYFTGNYDLNFDYNKTYPVFTQFNLNISQRFTQNLTGYLRIENLTNTDKFELSNKYETKPRTLILGVKIGGITF